MTRKLERPLFVFDVAGVPRAQGFSSRAKEGGKYMTGKSGTGAPHRSGLRVAGRLADELGTS